MAEASTKVQQLIDDNAVGTYLIGAMRMRN